MEKVRKGLKQGVEALEVLGEAGERALLTTVEPAELRRAWKTLTQAAEDLRPVERKADARRPVNRDICKALFVRYVRKETGRLHDSEVSELVNGALAPPANFIGVDEYDGDGNLLPEPVGYRMPDDPWEPTTVEAHRRWRTRNKQLLESADLEDRWQQAREHSYGPLPF
jgi:hypothetical protein